MCEGCGMLTLFSVEEYGIFFIFGFKGRLYG